MFSTSSCCSSCALKCLFGLSPLPSVFWIDACRNPIRWYSPASAELILFSAGRPFLMSIQAQEIQICGSRTQIHAFCCFFATCRLCSKNPVGVVYISSSQQRLCGGLQPTCAAHHSRLRSGVVGSMDAGFEVHEEAFAIIRCSKKLRLPAAKWVLASCLLTSSGP